MVSIKRIREESRAAFNSMHQGRNRVVLFDPHNRFEQPSEHPFSVRARERPGRSAPRRTRTSPRGCTATPPSRRARYFSRRASSFKAVVS